MTNFNTWVERLRATPTGAAASFLVMRTNIAELNEGTDEFVAQLLAACELPLSPRSWRLETLRPPYFCEYPASDDWRDLFPRYWNVHVDGDYHGPVPSAPSSPRQVAKFWGSDRTWQPMRDRDDRVSPCRVHGIDMHRETRTTVDLGVIAVVAERTRIEQARDQLAERGLSVSWRHTRCWRPGL